MNSGIEYYKTKLSTLRAEKQLIENSERLNYERQCISELIVLCMSLIHELSDIENENKYTDKYRKLLREDRDSLEASEIHNFHFQSSFVRVRIEYVSRALLYFDDNKNKTK